MAASARTNLTAFADAPRRPAIPDRLRDKSVMRIRAAVVRKGLFEPRMAERLRAADGTNSLVVVMNFFRNATLTVRWREAEMTNGTVTWNGTVDGAPLGNATLLFHAGSVTANITRGDGWIYQVRTAEDGTVWLLEVDQKALPRELHPLPSPTDRQP